MKKILIAEDEDTIRLNLTTYLEKHGYSVIAASNGKMAHDIIKDNPDIDLLLTDIIMPEMDGRDLVNHIRENEQTKDLPIIMISGFVPFHEIVEILEHGTTKFLPKPIKMAEVLENIEECLS